MSRAIDRHRAKRVIQGLADDLQSFEMVDDVDDTAIYGDSETTAVATGSVAEALKNIGTIAAASQKSKEDKAKAEKDKADADAKAATQGAALEAAQKARHEADQAAFKATNEANPAGPLHQAALAAAQKAAVLEQKVGIGPGGQGGFQKMAKGSSSTGWVVGGLALGAILGAGVGALVGGKNHRGLGVGLGLLVGGGAGAGGGYMIGK